MPPKSEQLTMIILDVGKKTGTSEGKSGKNFFQKAIECTTRIIERKIMSQGNDLIGIILLGSRKTNNNMAEQCPGAFKHIDLFQEFELPAWKMIRNLPDMPSKCAGDWFDALIVAADYFKNVSGIKSKNARIILITNFQSPSSIDENGFSQALNGFKEEDFQIDVIGCDIFSETSKNNDIDMVQDLVEGTNGVTAPFDDTMRYLLFHKKKHVNAMPWNVDLCIGPNIKIPVSSYLRLKDEPIVKKWTKAVKDPVTGTASCTEAVGKNTIYLSTENKNVLNSKEIMKGYHYGQKIIPFSECDKSLIYEPIPKSLTVYGFTHSSNIKWQNLNGDSLSYVFGRKGDEKAQYAITCLVQCLKELNLVAVARRVYNNGNAPRMYALMPVLDGNNFICLSMLGLCFKEEIKYMVFPSTNQKKFACTNDQVDAFKDLIKAMDLTDAYDDEEFDDKEAFPIGETVSPSAQYILDCIAFRAMNPGKPLPPPRNDIKMLFKMPSLIEKRANDPLKKLKSIFVLNKVEVKHRIKNKLNDPKLDNTENADVTLLNNSILDDMPKVVLPNTSKSIQKVGTIDPIGDYKFLLNSGKNIKEIAVEMTRAIESLVYSNLHGHFQKAFEAMAFFRTESVNSDPTHYNNWLKNFKTELYDRKRNDIIELIKEKNLNYVQKHENNLSNFDLNDDEDSQIYEMDTVPSCTEADVSTEVNNLFDDM